MGNASQHVVHPKIAVILGKEKKKIKKKTKVQRCFAPPSSSFVLFHSLILLFVGKVARQHVVPKFQDILEYLEYLNLDEPIIGKYFCSDIWQSSFQSLWLSHLLIFSTFVLGLSFLEEMPSVEPLLGPKYNCRLCNLSGAIVEMICHVIGRKHRQRYVVKHYECFFFFGRGGDYKVKFLLKHLDFCRKLNVQTWSPGIIKQQKPR